MNVNSNSTSTALPVNSTVFSGLVFCTNIIPSGSAFGVRVDNGDTVYIPSSVAMASKLEVGETVEGMLAPNSKEHRTPWLLVKLNRAAPEPAATPAATPEPAPEPEPAPVTAEPQDLGATVRSLVRGGGAWSVGSIYAKLFPNTARLENLPEYNRIVTVLTTMHDRGECVKVSIWGSGNKVKPGREFYCASFTEVLERLERS